MKLVATDVIIRFSKYHKLIIFCISVLLFFCIPQKLFAQERPPIQLFSSEDYQAQNQNWAIDQDENKTIYVGNNAGLLQYNGSGWTLHQVPNNTPIRSVKVIDDKLYTGSFMDFGYWTKSPSGEMIYTSVSEQFGIELLEDEEFWGIEEINGLVLFQSLNRIYVIDLDNSENKIIESDVEISKMLKFEQTIYLQKMGLGLFTIENERVIQKYSDQVFRDNRLISIVYFQGSTVFITDNAGLYSEESGQIVPSSLNTSLGLSDYSIYSALKLKNEGLALGTISNGLILINNQAEIDYIFKGYDTLSNNTVLSVFEDSQKNIWLGLDNGINCVNMASQFIVYRDDEGDLGTVYSAVVFNDFLYVGTNQGLFYKPWESDDPFKFVDGTQGQVWSLKIIDESLFCGHNSGTLIISDEGDNYWVNREQGTWDFKQLPLHPELIILGGYDGLRILEKTEESWRLRNKLDGFDISSRFFEIVDDQIIVNHEFKGLYSLLIDEEFSEVKSFNRIPLTLGTGSNVLKFSNSLIYSSTEGIYRKEKETEFIRDSILTSQIEPFENLTTLLPVNGTPELLWCFADENILFLEPGDVSGDPIAELIPVASHLRNTVAGFGNISKLNDNKLFIGTSYGYLVLNRDIKPSEEIPGIELTGVFSNHLEKEPMALSMESSGELESRMNNLRFNYAVPYYQSTIRTEYKSILEGFNENWTDWTILPYHEYENLPPGNYSFHVKGRIGTRETPNTASYSFRIKPPWYESNLMLVIYGLLLIASFFGINKLYERNYRKQRAKLIEENKKEIALKEMENKQVLMQLKNETLENDIENKNRELAISTMSLIKKNEFLNTIKGKLHGKNDENLQDVVKIIDRNLNNSDDWKMFEEAFNNADKDFLKKVKSRHPKLTSNDLRLCAYLRLNLSSKEIAPLLNISARSVEVKRYRLRKKMNLPHETNLTNYILDL